MTFGGRVKILREKQGLSQSELASRMDISQQAVAKYEKTIDIPKLATIRKIATALNVPLSELIDDWSMFSQGEIWDDLQNNSADYFALNPREAAKENKLLDNYHQLNDSGQDKAIEQVELLTKIPEYKADIISSEEVLMKLDEDRNLTEYQKEPEE